MHTAATNRSLISCFPQQGANMSELKDVAKNRVAEIGLEMVSW
jgi:hypothetical protein